MEGYHGIPRCFTKSVSVRSHNETRLRPLCWERAPDRSDYLLPTSRVSKGTRYPTPLGPRVLGVPPHLIVCLQKNLSHAKLSPKLSSFLGPPTSPLSRTDTLEVVSPLNAPLSRGPSALQTQSSGLETSRPVSLSLSPSLPQRLIKIGVPIFLSKGCQSLHPCLSRRTWGGGRGSALWRTLVPSSSRRASLSGRKFRTEVVTARYTGTCPVTSAGSKPKGSLSLSWSSRTVLITLLTHSVASTGRTMTRVSFTNHFQVNLIRVQSGFPHPLRLPLVHSSKSVSGTPSLVSSQVLQ